ncbi:hypothetical protein QAD02_022089 [Eretmocerus hayati]|uniref:Uncharacterized protein n=1 Tax=Eretmocerus hayati TaxID=131215 RepID=A0ACC2PWV9_9HYME|nr:hypothetical protein QAD02_022089 [Eretmocerus hayati]
MELWMKVRIFHFARIILRVPPLFVIDELLRIGLGVPEEQIALNTTEYGLKVTTSEQGILDVIAGNSTSTSQNWSTFYGSQPSYSLFSYQILIMTALRFLMCCLGCIAALCTFMLRTKQLVIVYLYLISVGTVFLSYWSHVSTMEAIISYLKSKEGGDSIGGDILSFQFKTLFMDGPGGTILKNYIFQSMLARLYCWIHRGPRDPRLQKLLASSFILPCLIGLYPLPMSVMTRVPVYFALLPLAICKSVLWLYGHKIWKTLYVGYQLGRTFISNYGLSALAESQWARLQVPSVLRTFWILRVAEQIVHMLISNEGDGNLNYYSMIKTLMVNGCETLTAVLGMTSIISVICHYIGSFFHWVLLIDNEDEKSMGTVSAMLFYILALQTGLTSLDKENRLLRLCRNLCLLFTAVLHFVHNIVNPLLMSLSASHNPALHRHIRALAVCAFLIVFPIWLLSFLWSRYTISTWLLAVNVFSIEVVVKVFVSLAIYSLFLYDAYRKNFWDELDDWVYIIRSFGNSVEFAFGIILFFNGFWILVFEAGGAIRAFMMCVHAYFNLWCEAKSGWSTFMKRRHAVNKINSLPEASPKQLSELQDVCAICYQEMETARITRCNHYFHGVCLRKWLYVQDRCPLCHEIMYKVNNQNESAPAPQENHENDGDRASIHGNIRGDAANLLGHNSAQPDYNSPREAASTSSAQEQTVQER